MIKYSPTDDLHVFIEEIIGDESLKKAILEGYSACFEAHGGIIRNLDAIATKYNLPAAKWDSEVKKEIYSGIDHAITGRSSRGVTSKDVGKLRDLSILGTEFGPPKMISMTMADLDDATSKNMRERIELLFVDPTQKIYQISKVPDDIRRYYSQYSMVMQGGASSLTPVLFINRNGEYELYEGNHRLLAVIKIAVEPMVDAILESDYDESNLIQDEIPGLKARIFRSLNDAEISFSINAYVGIPPTEEKAKSIASSVKTALAALLGQ